MSRVDGRAIWRAWKLVRAAKVDLFDPAAAHLLARVPGWSALHLPAEAALTQPQVSVLDALRAVSFAEAEPPRPGAQPGLVATVPEAVGGVPATRDVARALVTGASRELLVVGFCISERDFRDLLIRRGLAGVSVTLVGDRQDGGASDIRAHWPRNAAPLTALHDVEPMPGEARRMHAKVIVADRRIALIGSANFTFSGLNRNFELGVRCEGEVAEQACRTVAELRARGWLVPA